VRGARDLQSGPEPEFRRHWIDPPSGHQFGFPKLYAGEIDAIDFDAWLLANGYPAEMCSECPEGVGCRVVDGGDVAGYGITRADIERVDRAVAYSGTRPKFEVPKFWSKEQYQDPDTICVLVLERPSHDDLYKTVRSYGAGRVYAMPVRLAGTGESTAAQASRAAVLLSTIVADIGREAGLELDVHRSPWWHSIDERRRLSGAGMRTYLNVCAELDINGAYRLALLNQASVFDYVQWCAAADEHSELVLPDGAMLGISAMLGIYQAVAVLTSVPERRATWLHSAWPASPFPGCPIDYMAKGLTELIETRVWLSDLAAAKYP